ncbi:glycosyltransferase [Rhodococcus sp. NPDC003318]|uniref:glycosyltransferase n=1 Tax=Rhodococcus sp. NPDC003318 TaxID=3364503 RepID=UPI0036C2AFCA
MASILLCSAPLTGHVQPMLAIGRRLVEDGCDVAILTGRAFAERAQRAGLRFVALPPSCDYDDTRLDERFPGRSRRPAFLRSLFDAERMFAALAGDQYRAIVDAIDEVGADTVIVENLFMGALPLVGTTPDGRPKVFAVCTSPLMASSIDTAPFGPGLPPSTGRFGRLRNRVLGAGTRTVVMRRAQAVAARETRRVTGTDAACFLLDWPLHADDVFVLTTPGFEYPRTDIGERLTFVGPILPAAPADWPRPPWWDRLDTDRPVVLVTQGTLDNHDLGTLIEPTVDALSDADVLVVVATGGRPVEAVRRTSPNVIVTEFVPFGVLLPHVDAVVTNGGWGGVHFTLSHGVPLVVAGSTEDKAEIGARVARSGAGIRIRSGSPSPTAIRRAVDEVLTSPERRFRARALADELATLDATALISRRVREPVARPR